MPTARDALDDFILEQHARLNSEKTIQDYREKITMWIEWQANPTLSRVTTNHMRMYIESLRKRELARETIRSYITALKVAWAFWSAEYDIEDVMLRIRKPVKKKQPPKSISTDDFIKLFECAKGHRAMDWRNRAIIALLADTGARRGEIVRLNTDINVIRRKASVTGKTGTRTIFWTHYTNRLLYMWLAVRPECETQALFVSFTSGREHKRLTGSGLRQVLDRLKAKAKVKGRVNPHSFRHKFAQEYLKQGGDVITLAHLGGWQDLRTIKDAYAVFDEDELSDLQAKNSPLLKMLNEDFNT